jgi:hypothetical protein
MDFNKIPKLLCESATIGYVKHSFFFGFTSGPNQSAFAIPPEVAKGLITILQTAVDGYEKAFGTIDTSGNQTGIQSPISR